MQHFGFKFLKSIQNASEFIIGRVSVHVLHKIGSRNFTDVLARWLDGEKDLNSPVLELKFYAGCVSSIKVESSLLFLRGRLVDFDELFKLIRHNCISYCFDKDINVKGLF
jgi:hypothetical protein